MDEAQLKQIAATTQYVLLDFDGPVCDLFGNLTPDVIAASLLDELEGVLGGPVDEELADIDDPLDLLDGVSEIYPELIGRVDASVRDAEVDAAELAEVTPGAEAFLAACAEGGLRVAIVSNNGAEAVRALLEMHGLAGFVQHVEGRDPDPRLMKPDPTPLLRAMTALDARPESTVMIGDSPSDMLAASAAGVAAIALLSTPPARSGPPWVSRMSELASLFGAPRT
ncbi:HAD family hydrolase [Kineosporia succinea]|uniref:HAD superfamily hydrolase (TIGR01549 family) n=1 Tax=Kineosporia succinea TaxID=84632 RepID=A0ABT9NXD8_9ACTN|nr:HAD-IA family hydrolase [Kineosporia succinea]MDP9825099.1 HAD superfamily hydrolase (TIGR01549 family) [Kineosporia succinea]